ncbi:PPE domain-containing protein [Gandjariella thermophila]|uniref:PPE domain-containing protein n=1 Tax=Gandjariella thermophila TaxID=1931992 RepID=A0A4D4J3K4_9PSEU|nr:PPE domain-containing protein [Gandjariella thermophila]GDY29209.1 hypothetical protein GTS_08420 [Gandjariella thermophila]
MDQQSSSDGVVIGEDRVLNQTINWAALSHQELYDAVHQDNDPAQAYALAGEWNDLGAEMAEASRVLDQRIRATESGWQGAAADSARAATSQLASWGCDAALTSQHMSARINDQGQIVERAKAAMPEPVKFDMAKELAIGFATGGLFGLAIAGADVKAKSDQARAAHDRAVDVMTAMEASSHTVDGNTPRFVPPPNVVAPPPGGGPQPFLGGPGSPFVGGPGPVVPSVPGTPGSVPAGTDPAGQSPAAGDPAGYPSRSYQPATAPAAWSADPSGGDPGGERGGGWGDGSYGGGSPHGGGAPALPGGGSSGGVPGDGGGHTSPAAYSPPTTTNPQYADGYGALPDYGHGRDSVYYPRQAPQWDPSSSFGPRGGAAANEMADPNYWSRMLGSGGAEPGRGGARPGMPGSPGMPAFGPTGGGRVPSGGFGDVPGGARGYGGGGLGPSGAGRIPSGTGAGEFGPRGSSQPLGPGAASAAAEQAATGRAGTPGGRGPAGPGGPATAGGPMGAGAGARGGAQDKERKSAGYLKGEKLIEEPGRIVPPVIGETFKKKQP